MNQPTIVDDVLGLFRAAGFEVRAPSELDPTGKFAIAGSVDAAGVLMESIIEHFGKTAEVANSCAQRGKCESEKIGAAEKPTGDLTDERHPLVDLLKRAIGALAIHDEPEARAIGLEARELITDKFAARQSRQAERRIPDDVRRALDRMCTPLDESRLSGATAQEDARCMQIIKQFIEGTSPASQEGAHAAPEVRNAILDEAIAVVPGGSICDPQHVVDAIRSIKTPACAERSGDHA